MYRKPFYGIVALMFVDQLTIYARAGNGGNGVVRWRHEKFKPKAGPAGGDGGRGGDVYVRAVRDVNLLAKYTGAKEFAAGHGVAGQGSSKAGKNGEDLIIDVPVGARVHDVRRDRTFELLTEGERVKILKGGGGGLGNEYFKSSVNRSPQESTQGRRGEEGEFHIELSLVVDVGLIGFPNAGKSTLLNALTNAHSKVGAYTFTTTEPHLGDLYGFIIADIPGIIEGAANGKGLGHTFLRHVTRTKMLLHVISLESADLAHDYYTIRNELSLFNKDLLNKEEWIVLTKNDLENKPSVSDFIKSIDINENRVFVLSAETGEGVKELRDALVAHLRTPYNTQII